MNAESPAEFRARKKVAAPRPVSLVNVAQLAGFDEVIDVRSPGEFAEDHVPGAINCPVLDNDERARIGTLYKQVSPFEAKKTGAALVSRNIARHLEEKFLAKPKSWRPLIYCWRGGTRSGALTHIFRQIGWDAFQLDGGYKAYRRHIVAELATLPAKFEFRVICGPTGSGKSRLLEMLAEHGAQVLDLEQEAAHRGSVLGNLPGTPQPSQKMFESKIWSRLGNLDTAQPVFVEAESRKVGELRVPEALISRMWESRCVRLEIAWPARVALLCEDYRHFIDEPPRLFEKLDCLVALYSRDRIEEWKELAHTGRWNDLVADLLANHYDPAYARSTLRNYPRLAEAFVLRSDDASHARMRELALTLLAEQNRRTAAQDPPTANQYPSTAKPCAAKP